jgi:hypothetical protein
MRLSNENLFGSGLSDLGDMAKKSKMFRFAIRSTGGFFNNQDGVYDEAEAVAKRFQVPYLALILFGVINGIFVLIHYSFMIFFLSSVYFISLIIVTRRMSLLDLTYLTICLICGYIAVFYNEQLLSEQSYVNDEYLNYFFCIGSIMHFGWEATHFLGFWQIEQKFIRKRSHNLNDFQNKFFLFLLISLSLYLIGIVFFRMNFAGRPTLNQIYQNISLRLFPIDTLVCILIPYAMLRKKECSKKLKGLAIAGAIVVIIGSIYQGWKGNALAIILTVILTFLLKSKFSLRKYIKLSLILLLLFILFQFVVYPLTFYFRLHRIGAKFETLDFSELYQTVYHSNADGGNIKILTRFDWFISYWHYADKEKTIHFLPPNKFSILNIANDIFSSFIPDSFLPSKQQTSIYYNSHYRDNFPKFTRNAFAPGAPVSAALYGGLFFSWLFVVIGAFLISFTFKFLGRILGYDVLIPLCCISIIGFMSDGHYMFFAKQVYVVVLLMALKYISIKKTFLKKAFRLP